ncbi:MAG: hypothetical protein Q7S43_03320 [bacterium]|nr:hypothetical protein [bacterium]
MNQKLLITLTVVSLSFTAFLGGYLISQNDFHKNPSSDSTGNILDKFSNNNPDPTIKMGTSQTLRPLSPRSAISPVISKEKDSVLYYEKDTGKDFEVTLYDMREKSVSDGTLPNLIKTIWASSRKEVVSLFYYPKGNHYKYFNYKTKVSTDLGTDIKSLAFSPDGNQVVYFRDKEGSRGIFISEPDGSSFKNILPSRLENAEVYWPSGNLLSFKIEVAGGSELYSLSKTGEIKKILDSRDRLEVKWSGDGSKVLFSQQTDSGLGLFYKDISSESETPHNIATSESKCDWGIDGKSIVCGVSGSSGAGDEFYEIGMDGTKKLLSSPTTRIDTAELFLSGLDDYIVILNSLDNKLYMLKK